MNFIRSILGSDDNHIVEEYSKYSEDRRDSNYATEDDVSEENDQDVESTLSGAQDFYHLRDQCLAKRTLFEDPDFPASKFSLFKLYDSSASESPEVQWRRPTEIVAEPKFITEGFSRFDVRQGDMGNCWFLASIASLATVPELFEQVVPPDNGEFDGENYAGVFHFRFWQYGQWVDVVIDDRLPVNEDNKLLYVTSSAENEFWSALLEKAYAKLYGGYDALDGGFGDEATVDLSGGISEHYYLKGDEPSGLFDIIERNLKRHCLITTGIYKQTDLLTAVNLFGGHEYSLTRVARLVAHQDLPDLEVGADGVQLVCIRNPWGKVEWNGSWSDSSAEWSTVSPTKMKKLNLGKEDGEFWMDFKDFVEHFGDITMCHRCPGQSNTECRWQMVSQHGEWVRGSTAGGSDENSLWRNPQYLISIEHDISNEVERADEEGDVDENVSIIIGLMQKYNRDTGKPLLPIAYSVYPVPEDTDLNERPLPKSFFDSNSPVEGCPGLEMSREVSVCFSLPAGKYVLVPHTWKAQQEAEFLVRVFTEGPASMECFDEKNDVSGSVELDEENDDTFQSLDENFMGNEDDLVRCEDVRSIVKRMLGKSSKRSMASNWTRTHAVVHLYNEPENPGQLSNVQVLSLLHDIAMWRTVFKKCDVNNDGTLSTWELRNAFSKGGTRLNQNILNTIVRSHKYENLTLPEFVVCAIQTKKIIEQCSRRNLGMEIMKNIFSKIFDHVVNVALYNSWL